MTTGIIMSGTYVQAGLMAEFGKIPPSFLPLGNLRLYRQQIAMMQAHCDKVYLTTPDDFELPPRDRAVLEELGVQVLPCNKSLTVAEALLDGLSKIPDLDDRLIVLFGDSLFSGLTKIPADSYSAHSAVDEYKWDPAPINDRSPDQDADALVVSGLFSFSSTAVLKDALTECDRGIIAALRRYDKSRPLEMLTDGDWFDFGHTQTYYISCGFITTQRSFNSLQIRRQQVEKSSQDTQKMRAEANWFEKLPQNMRVYAPTYLGRTELNGETVGYRTENTYLSTLASLASFGNLNRNTWTSIFESCNEFLCDSAKFTAPDETAVEIDNYYHAKTEVRLKRFGDETGFDITSALTLNGVAVPSPVQMAVESADLIRSTPVPAPTFIHGDFCFSNIFFDFRSRMTKAIDPRGISPSGEITVFGDPRYDVAKLSHSALGRYDAIISGDVTASRAGYDFGLDIDAINTPAWLAIDGAFHDAGILTSDIGRSVNSAIMVHLFLSMIPLHADQPARQTAFLANAARLYLDLEK